MATAPINLPLYRVLRSLDVPEDAAASAAEVQTAAPVDLSHLATRDELRAELARFATRDELRAELARFATRDELRAEIAGVRAELRTEIAGIRTELRTEIAGVRTELAQAAQRLIIWLVGAIFAAAGLVVALLRAFPAK